MYGWYASSDHVDRLTNGLQNNIAERVIEQLKQERFAFTRKADALVVMAVCTVNILLCAQ
jgi:hypothetical protein